MKRLTPQEFNRVIAKAEERGALLYLYSREWRLRFDRRMATNARIDRAVLAEKWSKPK